MKALGLLIATATVAASVSYAPVTHAGENNLWVYGDGNSSCGQWTEDRRADGVTAAVDLSWALGFITGATDVASVNVGMHFKRVDVAGISGWLDNYCRAHPLDTFFRAAEVLANVLKAKK